VLDRHCPVITIVIWVEWTSKTASHNTS